MIALSVIIIGTMYLCYMEVKKIYSKISNIESSLSNINIENFSNNSMNYNTLKQEIDDIKNKLENYIETDTDEDEDESDGDDDDIPLNSVNINSLETQYNKCNFLEQSFNDSVDNNKTNDEEQLEESEESSLVNDNFETDEKNENEENVKEAEEVEELEEAEEVEYVEEVEELVENGEEFSEHDKDLLNADNIDSDFTDDSLLDVQENVNINNNDNFRNLIEQDMEIFIEKLNEKTCKELRTILKSYNIPSSGNKNVLIDKLSNYKEQLNSSKN